MQLNYAVYCVKKERTKERRYAMYCITLLYIIMGILPLAFASPLATILNPSYTGRTSNPQPPPLGAFLSHPPYNPPLIKESSQSGLGVSPFPEIWEHPRRMLAISTRISFVNRGHRFLIFLV